MNEKELARLAVEAESLHCNLKDFCRLLSITMDDFEDNGGLLARRKLTAGVLHVIFDYLDVLAGREAKLAAAMRGGRQKGGSPLAVAAGRLPPVLFRMGSPEALCLACLHCWFHLRGGKI